LYYLLFSSVSGGYVHDSVMISVMEQFISLAEPGCSWLTPAVSEYRLAAGSSAQIDLIANTHALVPGVYEADIRVRSNDTLRNDLVIPFRMEVYANSGLEVLSPDHMGQSFVGVPLSDTLFLVNPGSGTIHIEEAVVEGAEFSMELSDMTIEPGDSSILQLRYDPTDIGLDTARIVIRSDATMHPVYEIMVVAEALAAGSPQIISIPPDMILYLDGAPVDVYLDSLFKDFTGTALYYDVFLSDNRVIRYNLSENQLQLEPLAVGTTQVHISANNTFDKSTSISFNVSVYAPNSTEQEFMQNRIQVYPNPVRDEITIRLAEDHRDIQSVAILNASGIKVGSIDLRDCGHQGIRYSMARLTPGLYILRIQEGETVHSISVVRQ